MGRGGRARPDAARVFREPLRDVDMAFAAPDAPGRRRGDGRSDCPVSQAHPRQQGHDWQAGLSLPVGIPLASTTRPVRWRASA